jgi:hypothetical protein
VKQFNYRGVVRTFSNRYHIGTAGPADGAHWTTFSDAIVTAEKAIYAQLASGGAKIITTFGYAAGSEVPVFTKAYTTDGTMSLVSDRTTPGDVAALIRYSTPDRSTKNHPVYCYNFYHGAMSDSTATTADNLAANQAAAMGTYAAAWIAGFSDGTTTFHRSRPTGDLCNGYVVKPFLTHRDLPR